MLEPDPLRRSAPASTYPWVVVGLLWFCGFFNYADRQALSAVFPLIKGQFQLDDAALGALGSAFMLLYALTSPFTGYAVDRLSRRFLIGAGLAFWSLVCVLTGTARSYGQLLVYRAAEGLGESFYFPASMSVLADYHGKETRSRAMSVHQTSVYLGTAGGWYLGGWLGKVGGWQTPFWGLGLAGLAYAGFLTIVLVEPARRRSAESETNPPDNEAIPEAATIGRSGSLGAKLEVILRNPAALLMLGTFIAANFVAAAFLTWLPTLVERSFRLDLSNSALTSGIWPMASVPGAALGGWLADRASRSRKGGRIRTQAIGLVLAIPFVVLVGWSGSVGLLMAGLLGAGFCKGIYDANIFASLYDVIPAADRGTAAGVMNTVGWSGGLIAPVAMGYASEWFGLNIAFVSIAIVYVAAAIMALAAAWVAERHSPAAGSF